MRLILSQSPAQFLLNFFLPGTLKNPPALQRHRLHQPALGKMHSSFPGEDVLLFGLLQHRAGIGADFIADIFHGCCLGTSVIFHRSADDAAGIGDKIGQVQHPLGI